MPRKLSWTLWVLLIIHQDTVHLKQQHCQIKAAASITVQQTYHCFTSVQGECILVFLRKVRATSDIMLDHREEVSQRSVWSEKKKNRWTADNTGIWLWRVLLLLLVSSMMPKSWRVVSVVKKTGSRSASWHEKLQANMMINVSFLGNSGGVKWHGNALSKFY